MNPERPSRKKNWKQRQRLENLNELIRDIEEGDIQGVKKVLNRSFNMDYNIVLPSTWVDIHAYLDQSGEPINVLRRPRRRRHSRLIIRKPLVIAYDYHISNLDDIRYLNILRLLLKWSGTDIDRSNSKAILQLIVRQFWYQNPDIRNNVIITNKKLFFAGIKLLIKYNITFNRVVEEYDVEFDAVDITKMYFFNCILKMAIKYGRNENRVNNTIKFVQLLLTGNVNVNQASIQYPKNTPLHYITLFGSPISYERLGFRNKDSKKEVKLAKMLIEAKANVNATNNMNLTPLEYIIFTEFDARAIDHDERFVRLDNLIKFYIVKGAQLNAPKIFRLLDVSLEQRNLGLAHVVGHEPITRDFKSLHDTYVKKIELFYDFYQTVLEKQKIHRLEKLFITYKNAKHQDVRVPTQTSSGRRVTAELKKVYPKGVLDQDVVRHVVAKFIPNTSDFIATEQKILSQYITIGNLKLTLVHPTADKDVWLARNELSKKTVLVKRVGEDKWQNLEGRRKRSRGNKK